MIQSGLSLSNVFYVTTGFGWMFLHVLWVFVICAKSSVSADVSDSEWFVQICQNENTVEDLFFMWTRTKWFSPFHSYNVCRSILQPLNKSACLLSLQSVMSSWVVVIPPLSSLQSTNHCLWCRPDFCEVCTLKLDYLLTKAASKRRKCLMSVILDCACSQCCPTVQ